MEYDNCWYCGKVLNLYKVSLEHFIPLALGGKIADYILHEKCNNKLGDLDTELENQLNNLAFLSGVINNRNKDKIFKAYTKEGHSMNFNYSKKLGYEIIIPGRDDKDVVIYGFDLDKLKEKALLKLKQLFPDKSFTKTSFIENNLPKRTIYIKNKIGYKTKGNSIIGCKLYYREMCKIAIDFAVYWGIDLSSLSAVINYVKIEDLPNFHARIYSPDYYVPYYPIDDEISHFVTLHASSRNKSIFCYVELFNVECCLIRLNMGGYHGETIKKSYHYDIKNKKGTEFDTTRLNRNIERYNTLYTNSVEAEYIERVSSIEIQARSHRFYRITLPTVDGFVNFEQEN
jgi:hypothetical protein